MLLTNLNSISRYERMRRRPRPVLVDVEDVVAGDPSGEVDHDDGGHGLRVQRRPGEAARRTYRRRRELLAPERRRWPRHGSKGRRQQLGRIVDILG